MDVKISEIDINQIIGVALGLCVIYSITIGYKVIKTVILRILKARRLLDWAVKFAEANGFKDEPKDEDIPVVQTPAMAACDMIENVVNAPPLPTDTTNESQTKRLPYNIKRNSKIPSVEKDQIDFTRVNKIVGNKSQNQ